MTTSCIAQMSGAILLSLLVALDCSAEPTDEQLAEQRWGRPDHARTPDGQLNLQPTDRLEGVPTKFGYLGTHLKLMDQPGAEAELQQSLKRLQADPRVVEDVTALYELLTSMGREDNEFFGEARWRALHLLGELPDAQAKELLFKVASTRMPDPEQVGEMKYNVEFRLRARAITGLEKHEDIQLLTQIYNNDNLLRGLAAASLYELGHPPKGIIEVDGTEVLGYGDPRDHNTNTSPEGDPGNGDEERIVRPTGD